MEILICQYKDPYKPISITECHPRVLIAAHMVRLGGFFWGVFFVGQVEFLGFTRLQFASVRILVFDGVSFSFLKIIFAHLEGKNVSPFNYVYFGYPSLTFRGVVFFRFKLLPRFVRLICRLGAVLKKHYTLPETNTPPEGRPSQKGNFIFPTISLKGLHYFQGGSIS